MSFRFFQVKKTEECQLHGASSKSANKTLLFMVFASFSLIIWHVWVYGPSGHLGKTDPLQDSFLLVLGSELWDLLFNPHGILAELWSVFPYYLVGIFLAGYLRTYKIAVKLQASLRRYGVMSVFLASFVGIITPLCACGTLTTAVSLLFAGIPLAPVISLMVTSPLLSPSTYLLTLNDLGPEWTVIRTIAAFSMGIFAGLVTHFLRNKGFKTEEIFIEGGITRGDFHDADYPDERLRCNCKEKFGNRVAVRTNNKFLIFLAKSSEMLWLVGKYILVGVVIGAVVERYMPVDWIYRFFGQGHPLNIVWVTLGSVPIFLHQVSASSILYHIKSSLNGTLDGGAGLAMMIGGPVTAVPTMLLFWTIFKKRVFFLYMTVCLLGTILIAYTFQFLVFIPGMDTGNRLLRGVGSVSGGKSPIIQKQNQNVRIVMAPSGHNIVATYSDDLGKSGGVVFDADSERFLSVTADNYDNGKYAKNIAAWLEDNNTSSVKGNILVYTVAGQNGQEIPSVGKRILANLKQQGFHVTLTDRRKTPKITGQLLASYGQLWLFCLDSGAGPQLSDSEEKAVSVFSDDGKSMLIVPGKFQSIPENLQTVNKLSSPYGVRFSGIVENNRELPVSVESQLFNRAAEMLGRILKLVNKA